ncbi:hypothetical protein [Paeniglutamicibacter sp. NPDC091659]|uniref:hypothetical protein n=1 Tax=Paeniglutamicibacter sp. NPDC091659 TaxID=3364389 RepID=UPI00380E2218
MKATSNKQAPLQVTKDPKMIAVREALPWLLVAIMTFAIAGIITGWFMRSYAVTEQQTAIALASKVQSR